MTEKRISGIDVFRAEPPAFQSQALGLARFAATLDPDALAANGGAGHERKTRLAHRRVQWRGGLLPQPVAGSA